MLEVSHLPRGLAGHLGHSRIQSKLLVYCFVLTTFLGFYSSLAFGELPYLYYLLFLCVQLSSSRLQRAIKPCDIVVF